MLDNCALILSAINSRVAWRVTHLSCEPWRESGYENIDIRMFQPNGISPTPAIAIRYVRSRFVTAVGIVT